MRRLVLVLAGLAALTGCSVGPEYRVPPLPAAPALASGRFVRADAAATRPRLATPWWEAMGDATLARLIEQGLRKAPAMAVAEARLREARAGLASTRAAALPSLGGSLLYAHADLPANALGGSNGQFDLFNAGFDAQWEVDLWGGRRHAREKTRDEAAAAAADVAGDRMALAAEIGRTYTEWRARQVTLPLLEQRIALEARLGELERQRVEAGTAPRQGAEMAAIRRARSEAERTGLIAEIAALADGLAVLTGDAPGAMDGMGAGAVPLPPAALAVGDPAAMLQRRPDVAAAERRLAAATAQLGVDAASRFPQVSLMGVIGLGGTSAGDVLDASQLSTIAVPRLTWNLLDFGRARATRDKDRAGRDVALAQYRGAVLAALRDAETALGRFGAARAALAGAIETERRAETMAMLDGQRADAGAIARGGALEAERQAIDARIAAIDAQARVTQAFIALSKAMGLGWQADQTR